VVDVGLCNYLSSQYVFSVGRQAVSTSFYSSILKRRMYAIPLPGFASLNVSSQSSHAAYYVATQMALAHNGILRGLNSIYLQATHIPREALDVIEDFLTYCQCWCESMHHHHDAEEKEFFPSIELISGVQGIMERNVEQHRAFTPGFDLFQEYSRTCPPEEYQGEKIKSLIEAFAEPLAQHLHDEIDTLRALDVYDSEGIRKAYKRFEKMLMATDNVRSNARASLSTALTYHSIESPPSCSELRTEASKGVYTISRQYHFLCLT
jgi:hypothetical protein